jgi:hypothetical protein
MTPAAALVRNVAAVGAELRLVDGAVKVRGLVSPEMRAALREARGQVAAILAGNACRWCGEPLAWPGPVGITFADGAAECLPYAGREVGRLLAAGARDVAPELAADPAEVMVRGELE